MVDTYESLNERFPIIDVAIKHLSCNQAEKKLIKNSLSLFTVLATTNGKADG